MIPWTITPWEMDGRGGWKTQPIILVEKEQPFTADRPEGYIQKIQELHDDPAIMRGAFYTLIGQFRDNQELYWQS